MTYDVYKYTFVDIIAGAPAEPIYWIFESGSDFSYIYIQRNEVAIRYNQQLVSQMRFMYNKVNKVYSYSDLITEFPSILNL